jgi:hypothetical protein
VDDPRFRGDWLRFPHFAAQSGEMLAFVHISTGTHTPATKNFNQLVEKKRKIRARRLTALPTFASNTATYQQYLPFCYIASKIAERPP